MEIWKEIDISMEKLDTRFTIQINHLQFTIIKLQQEYYGIESVCPHSGGPLGMGDIEDLYIKCPWHGYRYSLGNGSCDDDPDHSACVLPVKVENGKIYIKVLPNDQITIINMNTLNASRELKIIDRPLEDIQCNSLIDWARNILNTSDAVKKVEKTLHVLQLWKSGEIIQVGKSVNLEEIPPRDSQITFTIPTKVGKRGNAGTLESRIAILHALANIEQWAIDLGWDIIVRFGEDLPREFCSDFIKLAADEAKHFKLLENRLKELGSYFGALKIHGSLWDAALETKDDVLARLAIVHMVHEGRGLDVNPKTIEKFRKAKDFESVEKLEIIHSDEITHVALGQKWFKILCLERNLDQYDTFHVLVRKYYRGLLKPPFNKEDRSKAGLDPKYYMPLSVALQDQVLSMNNLIDIFLYLALFLSTVLAQNTVPTSFTFEYTPSVIVSGILTILIGLVMLFFGYRSLKFLLFFAGFYVFSIIGYTILTKANAANGNPNVLLWGSLGIGILGGILAILVYRLGISLLGALGGISVALWILSLKAGGLLTDDTQRIIFVVVFALVGAIVIHFAEKPVIILASSFAGAYSICYGIDTFVNLGYAGRLKDAFNSGIDYAQLNTEAKEIGWQLGLLLAANIILFILGAWYQFRSNRDRDHTKVMWFLKDCYDSNVLWLKPNQEYTIGKRNKNLVSDPSMSRTHAVLSNCGSLVIVKDSNSTHGTWVKKSNSDFKREKEISLENNDQVRFGLLTVYTIVYIEMIVSFSSVSSHDMIKLNQFSCRNDLILKKELVSESACLVTGGNSFSGKQALALVMQIPVVSLEWLYAWDDVDSYSFKVPEFEKYLPAAIKVKNEILDRDLWKINSQRKVMLNGLEFILSGDKENLEITKNVINAAGGTASIECITKSNASTIRKGVILVCDSTMIDWIKSEKLNIKALSQDDLGGAILKGGLNLDSNRNTRSLLPTASLRELGSVDLFDDPLLALKGRKVVDRTYQERETTSNGDKVQTKRLNSKKDVDVFNLFDNEVLNNQNDKVHKISGSKNKKTNGKTLSKAPDVFDLFDDDLLHEDSKIEKGQNKKGSDKESMKQNIESKNTIGSTTASKKNSIQTTKGVKKKINLDSFFDSLLNVDDDLQSQDPSVRENSIEDSIKQKESIHSPIKTVKEENSAPIGTLKGKTTSLAERLGIQPALKEDIIPSSLPLNKKYSNESISNEESDVMDIVVPATPVNTRTKSIDPKQIVLKSPTSTKQETKSLESNISSSIRNQELIDQALKRERTGIQKIENMESIDSKKSYSHIIISDSLVVGKDRGSLINTKRFVSNRVKYATALPPKKPPIKMKVYYRNTVDDELMLKQQSRIRNGKKRNWTEFSSDDENE